MCQGFGTCIWLGVDNIGKVDFEGLPVQVFESFVVLKISSNLEI